MFINHNWINGCNIMLCWSFIKDSLLDVQKQIEDCREMDSWHQQCQVRDCLHVPLKSPFLSAAPLISMTY